jgi:ATP-dependent DNA helicase DinG
LVDQSNAAPEPDPAEPAPGEPDTTDRDTTVANAAALLSELVAGLPDGGEPRDGQVEMAERVAESLHDGTQISVKAGTGTGKSLALLAAVSAARKRTIIATATKALQDQYVQKELPHLDSLRPTNWAVIKGRSNYACLARIAETKSRLSGEPPSQEALFTDSDIGAATGSPSPESDQLTRVLDWVGETTEGDLSELPFEMDRDTLEWVATGPENCPGAKLCTFSEDCFAERAIESARAADVVVVNTSLLGADLVAESGILGEAEAIVLDEAHVAEDILASSFGAEIQAYDIERLNRSVRSTLKDTTKETLSAELTDGEARLSRELDLLEGESFEGGLPPSGRLSEVLTDLANTVAKIQQEARTLIKGDADNPRAETLRRTADRVFSMLTSLLDTGEDDALFVDDSSRRLKRVPIDVSAKLAQAAWGDSSVVLTSATLPSTLGRRLGFGADATHVDVGSPFNYRDVAMLYVPPLLSNAVARDRTPNHPDWFAEAWDEARLIINAAGGRTLFLCTSHRNAQEFAENARDDLAFPILVQGDAPKAKLLADFAADPEAVLFGTMGLWQGVDVVGKSLSCVIVDKLPFPRPDDPLWQARARHARHEIADREGIPADDAGYRSFLAVQVPYSGSMLSQGVGRLIRSSTDKGLVMVLDPRLAEKGYRKEILAELPPFRRSRTRSEAIAHLHESIGQESIGQESIARD